MAADLVHRPFRYRAEPGGIEPGRSLDQQNFLFVVPGEDDDVTLEWLVERLSSAVVRHGVKLLIIDPWNEIEHDRPPHLTSTEYTGLALRALKRFARSIKFI